MRKALVIGVNYYEHENSLYGCVTDANSVKNAIERNGDGSINFSVRLLTAKNPHDAISKMNLKDLITDLFSTDAETALFYFAGHGHIETTGGYILASDARRGDDGIPLAEVLTLANKSRARNKIIILDSCHSGIAGALPSSSNISELTEGLTILTASTAEQYATEKNGSGVFTGLLIDAINGAAANLLGEITPGSVYAHIDQALGPWDQRPVFKTNVKSFMSLRRVQPAIAFEDLRKIADLFPSPRFHFKLNPTFEPEMKGRTDGMPVPILEHTHIFAILQKYNRVNLVVPVGAAHMWNAAMESKACMLTSLGEHYRRLAERKLL